MSPLLAGLLAGVALTCFAQDTEGRVRDSNLHSWWVYAGDHPVKGPWGVYSEVQMRRANFANAWQQFQLREAATYRFSPRLQTVSGYMFNYTGRYGDFPVSRAFNEHRFYQQLTVQHSWKRLEWEHRSRVEQRWIQTYIEGDGFFWQYQNRFRHQTKVTLPMRGAGHRWYLFAGDEIFFPFGANRGPNSFDQNRAFGGVGYKLTRNNKLEVGYLHQFFIQRNNSAEESNHTLRVMWTSGTALGRLFR